MTQDDIIRMARKAGWVIHDDLPYLDAIQIQNSLLERIERLVHLVSAHEREALESELLKLKEGIAAPSQYIQGRWDLIGEFQDIIRARGNK